MVIKYIGVKIDFTIHIRVEIHLARNLEHSYQFVQNFFCLF